MTQKVVLDNKSLDNIRIGGRNILRSTNQGSTNWRNSHANGVYSTPQTIIWLNTKAVYMNCTETSTDWRMITYSGLLDNWDLLIPNGIYTLSYDTDGSSDLNFGDLMASNTDGPIVSKIIKSEVFNTSYGKHYSVTFQLKDNLVKNNQVVYFYHTMTAGKSIIIANLKLESGTIDTAYCPAIEDLKDETVKNNMGFKWDLLWTNPNHNANFGAQTINIDLSTYNIICMKVKSANETGSNYVTHLFFMYPDGDYYLIQSSYPSNWNVHKRRCKVNSNSIIFENALYSSSSSDTGTIINHCCIPMTIYGIKLI